MPSQYTEQSRVGIVQGRDVGRLREFAFIEMEIDKQTQEAHLPVNGLPLRGTTLTVNGPTNQSGYGVEGAW